VLRARRRLGLSQQALADRAGMGRSEIGDFEHGKRDFRLFSALRIVVASEIDIAELFSALVDWYVRPLSAPEYAYGARPPSKAERDALLVQLWHEGKSEKEIAETLELSVAAVGPYVRELRDAGQRLSYRRLPRRIVEVSARHRRELIHATQKRQP
jgi:transcriptional regulator with XRE-family HTH domain